MKEILFRGKRLDNGEWVQGYYVNCFGPGCGPNETRHYIVKYPGSWHEVYTSTVGQYTGLTDKNGKMIFEGDILEGDLHDELDPGAVWRDYVVWHEFGWHTQSASVPNAEPNILVKADGMESEVIGNIHDNPELLGGADNG